MSALLELPRATVSAVIVKWKGLKEQQHEIGFHGLAAAHHPEITMRNAKRRLKWYKARCHCTLSRGNTFSAVMNHTSPSGSPTDTSGFGNCQENATCPTA
jgi:hypothetical protein